MNLILFTDSNCAVHVVYVVVVLLKAVLNLRPYWFQVNAPFSLLTSSAQLKQLLIDGQLIRFRTASFIALRRRRVSETFDTKAEGYFATLQYDIARHLGLENTVNSRAAVLELALSQLTLNGHREHTITALVTVCVEPPSCASAF